MCQEATYELEEVQSYEHDCIFQDNMLFFKSSWWGVWKLSSFTIVNVYHYISMFHVLI